MDASMGSLAGAAAHDNGPAMEQEQPGEGRTTIAAVDPFLVEALENPRHRLTVLRMELDIQKFMQNSDERQFEFQHLPTSYLRCAAHRVAQHYGLQTMVLDNALDSFGSKVVARKTPESRYPITCLSDIPMKQSERRNPEQLKFVIRPRPSQASIHDATEAGTNRRLLRTVEERKEEYDKARARIFSAPSSPEANGTSSNDAVGVRSLCSNQDELAYGKTLSTSDELEKINMKDGSSTMAIFRDREKDSSDPDYDRSYDRYARGFVPCHDFNLVACNVVQPAFLQYEPGVPQLGQFPRTQTPVSYMPLNSLVPFCHVGCNQTPVYMQWPSPAMGYARSYDHFRHAIYPASYQQPLSLEQWPNR